MSGPVPIVSVFNKHTLTPHQAGDSKAAIDCGSCCCSCCCC